MMVLEEIWSWTTLTLEVVWMNDLESTSLSLSVSLNDLEEALFYCSSSLCSCDSSWRNSMVSCVCCRCRERSTRVSLLMCTMSSSLEMIKLWRMCNNWICCAIWTCSLEIRLSCCRYRALNCFTWFCYLNDRLACYGTWMARLLDFLLIVLAGNTC